MYGSTFSRNLLFIFGPVHCIFLSRMISRSIFRAFSSQATETTQKPRVISFDLPAQIDSTRVVESERRRRKLREKQSSVAASSKQQHAIDEYFPTTALSPQPETLPDVIPVKRPNLWIPSDEKPSITDVGRFMRFSRDSLMSLMPEGLAGDLPRDIFLMPSRTRDVGIMYRKVTHELIQQLEMMGQGTSIPKKGWLLEGKRGSGKSAILNSTVAWARNQGNWVVLFEPLGSRFGKEIANITRSSSGVYIQNELAKEFLERFLLFNKSLVEQIPVDLQYYGRIGVDSTPVEKLERVYLPLISKAVNTDNLCERIEEISRLRNSLVLPSMKSKLANPATVLDICQFGIENGTTFATQAVGELINQLKVQSTFPVLVAIDEWNEMFVVSEYVSTRYDNTIYNGYIPSYHLSLPRMLSRWDGNEFKRGLKLFSTCWSKRNRRQFNPTLLGIKAEEIKQVRNFTKNEFDNYCAYQALTNTSHRFPESKLDYFYMLTQGNGFETRRMMATLY